MKKFSRPVAKVFRSMFQAARLSHAAKAARRSDRRGLPESDPGIDRALTEAVGWLGRAQDNSRSHDGGVARHFSLINGWGSSYPETTGYIVPTMLAYARSQVGRIADEARDRARKMLDWLVAIQFPDGGYQGGAIGQTPVVPVTFNTGQIVMGLAAGVEEFGCVFRDPMKRAADWLVATQDSDGCWRSHPTPFAEPGEKAYETHVAWGLLEAARVDSNDCYKDAALANIAWSLRSQRHSGWFDKCCLHDPERPLTHTIGYALRGVLEAYRTTGDSRWLVAARKTADGALAAARPGGYIPGQIDSHWHGVVPWACLTGSVQIAHCWLMLYQFTRDTRYRDAAFVTNSYVRRTLAVDGPLETRGGIRGSFPINGAYEPFRYLNWACKFFIDSNMLESAVRREEPPHT